MLIRGLEARVTDLARGVLVLRATRLLTAEEQAAILARLGSVGMTEPPAKERPESTPRCLVAIPWAPPTRDDIEKHRQTVEELGTDYELEDAWFVKVETAIDGVVWRQRAEESHAESDSSEGDNEEEEDEAQEEADDDEEVLEGEDEEDEGEGEDEDEETAFDEVTGKPAILYAAPDAPATLDEELESPDDADHTDEDDESAWASDGSESHWRNGAPPQETSSSFPLENYPEVIEDFDWEDMGVALKLGGDRQEGEDSVVNAFFALWLSAYQDERMPHFEVFQGADVVHDRDRRSVLLWIERFAVPANGAEQIHFLVWILNRMSEVLTVAWARFEQCNTPPHSIDERGTFVLAGNPLSERFHRLGESAALAWATHQSLWDRREIAAMLIELALSHDPQDEGDATTAERLLLKAIAFDPRSEAKGYLCSVLLRQGRYKEAYSCAESETEAALRGHFYLETLRYAPDHAAESLALVPDATLAELDDDDLADLAKHTAEKAVDQLDALLARLPDRSSLIPHLYNASFPVQRPQGLSILSRVITLPEPDAADETGRAAFVMAWNNACIHAHALGEFARACTIAEGAQRFGPENPYIFHSAACAFASAGDSSRALEQVQSAIAHDYAHIEKMEVDRDLGALRDDTRFHALFSDWRSQRGDLN